MTDINIIQLLNVLLGKHLIHFLAKAELRKTAKCKVTAATKKICELQQDINSPHNINES